MKAPTAPYEWSASSTWKTPTATSTPTSTTIQPIGRRTSKALGPRSSTRRTASSPTSSPPWEPAGPLPVRRAACADQYNNPANWKAHFEGTGPEILHQTNGELTHFVAAMGTSGTFTGTTRRLRRDLPEVKCYSAQPSSGFHGLEGLKHMPTAIRPGFYDDTMADGNLWIETEDAYRMVRRLAKEEGLLVGISSGCNVYAATLLAREIAARGESATIVTILCDSAEKYLSENFWDQE